MSRRGLWRTGGVWVVSGLGDAWGILRVGVIPGDSVERMRAMEKGRAGVGMGAALWICVLFLL